MTQKRIHPAGFFRKGFFGSRRRHRITATCLGAGFYSENGIGLVRLRVKVRSNVADEKAVVTLHTNDFRMMRSVPVPLRIGDNYCEFHLPRSGFDRSMLLMGSRLRFFFCVRAASGEVFRGAEFPISVLELMMGGEQCGV